ncbi:MAG: queuine tRNA-ribosyltransferase containing PUA domain protein [Methanomassiliicoccales archaeon Mx-03]|nr:MAG: queuine tRNA-ribosyltransferase containing PUA domain protein [Methanomassiliicoccales archaeon Mx-03]
MLDIVARSQRGRVCEYSRDGNVLETPAMIRSEPEGPVCIAAGEGGRVLRLFGAEVPLESGLLTTASSGMESSSVVKDGVQVVRLPLPEDLVIDDSADVVVVPNAYELRKDPRRIVDVVVRLREAAGFGRLLCMLGIGEPSTVAILSYMGVDLFDDSLPRAAGLERVLLMPEAEVAMGDGDVAGANVDYMEAELAKVRMFIRADRLRELADQRSFSSPSNVALLRLYDQNAYGYVEETCSTVGCRFSCNSTQALRRPDLKRYRDRMRDYRKPEHKRILLLLPCSAKKPYHISKTHRAFASAIHTAQHDTLVHEVIVTSPLGMVPRELDACYPANSYDIPVTGEWKCEERAMIREMVGSLIQQGYDKVICHLGDDYELVEGLAEMECTVVGDPTSPKSLENLDKALRAAAKGMEPVDYLVDRNNLARGLLEFQFGRDIADILMDENTYAIGKFPYWKFIREDPEDRKKKTQLGMMTPERGMVSLTLEGAEILAEAGYATVEIMDFELKGNLFAVGVIRADPRIRIGDEAIIVCDGQVRGVGVAMMCGREMTDLKRGIAVKVRHKIKS